MYRIFHLAGLCWMGALLLMLGAGLPPLALLAAAGAVFAGAALLRAPRAVPFAAACCMACAGWLLLYNALELAPSRGFEGRTLTVTGTVVEATAHGNAVTFYLRASGGLPDGLRGETLRLVASDGVEARAGDVVKCRASLHQNPDEARAYLLAAGTRFSGRAGRLQKTGESRSLTVWMGRWRDMLARNITRNLTGDEGRVLAGMLLGQPDQVPREIREDYTRAGLAHLLAVSGLHLTILTALFGGLLRCLRVPVRRRAFFLMPVVLAYMALTGFRNPVLRAGFMLLFCLAGELFGREADPLNSLGLAVLLLLLHNPYGTLGVSLQLTYFACLGILTFSAPLTGWLSRRLCGVSARELRKYRAREWIVSSAASTLAATLATAPSVCLAFGELPLLSPLSNLAAMPLVPVALGGGLLCAVCGCFPPLGLLGRVFGLAAGLAVNALDGSAAFWASLPFASLPVVSRYPAFWLAGALAGAALLHTCKARLKTRRAAAACALAVLLCGNLLHALSWRGAVAFCVVRYGNSLAAVSAGQAVVIGAPAGMEEARGLERFFSDRGAEEIALLVLETGDELYGDPAALLAGRFPVRHSVALDECNGFDAILFRRLRVYAEGRDAGYVLLSCGGFRFVKQFDRSRLPARLLITDENVILWGTHPPVKIREGYGGAALFAVREKPLKGVSL